MTQPIAPVTGGVISSGDTQTAIWFLGVLSQVRLSGEQTGGAFSLTDNLARRGDAIPVHLHDREDETLVVLDGDLRGSSRRRRTRRRTRHGSGAGEGSTPRVRRHLLLTARFLTLHNPGGFEHFAAEVGEPARALTLPPKPAVPPDFVALTGQPPPHGITILAPPPEP